MDAIQFEENVLEPHGLLPRFCGTWVNDPDIEEVACKLGADLPSQLDASWQETEEGQLLVDRFGDWTLALERDTRRGADRHILRSLSSTSLSAVNIWWDVNGVSSLTYGANGRILAKFELALGAREHWTGEDPRALDRYLDDLPLGMATANDSDCRFAAFVLIKKMTGIMLNSEWLGDEHPCYTFQYRRDQL
ncbi:DUF6461 domain-containing protein [Sphaerimonospora cavernae]|uniref:DUF6461 domain-containing protein n=1 Tax=Sphaerimonospora cavernae TaxID=1740611 RepID=A0ABV6UA01_9ACTN